MEETFRFFPARKPVESMRGQVFRMSSIVIMADGNKRSNPVIDHLSEWLRLERHLPKRHGSGVNVGDCCNVQDIRFAKGIRHCPSLDCGAFLLEPLEAPQGLHQDQEAMPSRREDVLLFQGGHLRQDRGTL